MTSVNWETARPYLIPSVIILAAVAIGVGLQAFASKRLAASAFARRHTWLAMALDAFDVVVIVWVVSAGIRLALQFAHIPASAMRIADDVLLVLVCGSLTLCAARFSRASVLRLSRGASEQIASGTLFAGIAEAIVISIGALIIMSSLGIKVTPILTALGVGGLAVALALQPPLANLFSGLQLIASRQIRPGDYVWISSGEEGFVEDINWRSVSVRSSTNAIVIIPNLTLATATFVNYKLGQPSVAVGIPLKVAYGSDLAFVEQLIRSAVERLGKLRDGGDVTVAITDIPDTTVQLTVSFRVQPRVGQVQARDAFFRALYDELQGRGIENFTTKAVVAATSTPVPTHP